MTKQTTKQKPHVNEILKIRSKCGSPRRQADQTKLKAIIDIAFH